MANLCKACGATLADGQAFCTACGIKAEVPAVENADKFCMGCGGSLSPGTKFCAKCGRAVHAQTAVPTISLAAISGPAAPAPAMPPVAAQNRRSGIGRLILALISVFMFVGVLSMATCAYVAYRAKTKVENLHKAYENNDADRFAAELGLKEPGSGDHSSGSSSVAATSLSTTASSSGGNSTSSAGSSPVGGLLSALDSSSLAPELPHWKSYSGSPAANNASIIPLKQGLTFVGAVNEMSLGDYEAITTVDRVGPDGVAMEIQSQAPPKDANGRKAPGNKSFQGIQSRRKVLAQDLASAHEINLYFSNRDPLTYPGTTSGSLSKEVFNQLKIKGETSLTYRLITMKGALTGLIDKLSHADGNGNLNFQDLTSSMSTKIDCTLRRAEQNDVAFPVILNDKPVELPAIHTVCKSDQDEFHLYLLDDAENPATLSGTSRLGHFRTQIIRISFPEDKPVNQIEQALKQTGKAQVYGINFDFASATIRPQSKPVLEEIAKAMKDNPAWKVSVNGHTDNIGGDASNLELSKKRAEAVVQSLTTQYHIAESRFASAGFGASRPIDTNDTMEGRARNRRVELILQE